MHLVIDDKIPYIREAAARLGEATYLPGAAITAADVRSADALIIRTRTRCDEALLGGSSVQFVATATIGHDHIDTAFMQRAGIGWTNCPGCNAGSVAQYVACSLLLLRREGLLPPLRDCVVGIVGVGHVGRRVEDLLHRMGCRVLRCDPPRAEREGCEGFVSLDEVARRADVVTLHTPLTTQGPHATFHMADAAFFAALRRRPVFINSSRGEVVDTPALLQAIRLGHVGPTVIDTWEDEPCISRELLRLAHIATPHIAGYSADGKARGTQMALSAVARHFGLAPDFDIAPPPLPADFCALPGGDARPLSEPLGWYDPRRDTEALRLHPEAFERLRGNYPLRRECAAELYENLPL